MAQSIAALDPEKHLLLEEPLLRLPYELLRKNLKAAQRHVERETTALLTPSPSTAFGSATTSREQINKMVTRLEGLKRKMNALHEDEINLHTQSRKRITHLNDLYAISTLEDERYEAWSQIRLDRLLIDFLLRSGYGESARKLAEEKGVTELVDIDVFVGCRRIQQSLTGGSVVECLAWWGENKVALKKNKSTLEFELRLQQYIELVRSGDKLEARKYCQKHLASHYKDHPEQFLHASALLAYSPTTPVRPYKDLYSPTRWTRLAEIFVSTHHQLFSLPSKPLLHIALSAGLSSLKTPSCHSIVESSSTNTYSSSTSLCPICSTELNDLAKGVPYALHTKSSVENDPVLLPSGRVYGRQRLEELSLKLGLPPGRVRDPTTQEEWGEEEMRKVFIS